MVERLYVEVEKKNGWGVSQSGLRFNAGEYFLSDVYLKVKVVLRPGAGLAGSSVMGVSDLLHLCVNFIFYNILYNSKYVSWGDWYVFKFHYQK